MEKNNLVDSAINSWRIICIATITLAVGFYLYVQGAHVGALGTISKETTKHSAAVYGVLVLIPLCAFFYSYTYQIIKLHDQKKRLLRIPLIYELHLSNDNSLIKKARIITFIVILIVPMFSLGHCVKKSLQGTIYLNENCIDNRCTEMWSSGLPEALTKFSSFMEIFTDGNKYRFDGQITYFPGWQPWFFLFLSIWVTFLWGRVLNALIRKKA